MFFSNLDSVLCENSTHWTVNLINIDLDFFLPPQNWHLSSILTQFGVKFCSKFSSGSNYTVLRRMTTLQRLALLGKDVLFSSRISPASQQLSSLRSFSLDGLGSTSSSQWAWSEALGVQRILSLIPSLADVQLWAVPKRKVCSFDGSPLVLDIT
jgi:hypothetical protein